MLQPYNLADLAMIEFCKSRAALVDVQSPREHYAMQYIHPQTVVVLGASNILEASVYADACEMDGVPVIKRPSGGEAVVVSSRTLLFTHCLLDRTPPKSAEIFQENLSYVLRALEAMGVTYLRFNGISDLCIGERKILGCAIYRRPGMALFQAVLNVDLDPILIARYLRQPTRMPDYRRNRPHTEFVTSLRSEGYSMAPDGIDILGVMRAEGVPLSSLPRD